MGAVTDGQTERTELLQSAESCRLFWCVSSPVLIAETVGTVGQ